MADDRLSINIQIAERSYPLTIKREDEEKIRKAASLINHRISKYRGKYSDKDTYDYLAMTTLQYGIELIENDYDSFSQRFIDEIKQINSDIDTYLDQNSEE
ncbi:MAG: cell division protein ZapA [Bacteroidota bacterium]|nr:cell division protein ZapA [Bacteroidota bacterium]